MHPHTRNHTPPLTTPAGLGFAPAPGALEPPAGSCGLAVQPTHCGRRAALPAGRFLPAASSSDAIALPQPAGLLATAAIASVLAGAPPQRMPLPLAYLELVARLCAPRPASTGSSHAV